MRGAEKLNFRTQFRKRKIGLTVAKRSEVSLKDRVHLQTERFGDVLVTSFLFDQQTGNNELISQAGKALPYSLRGPSLRYVERRLRSSFLA